MDTALQKKLFEKIKELSKELKTEQTEKQALETRMCESFSFNHFIDPRFIKFLKRINKNILSQCKQEYEEKTLKQMIGMQKLFISESQHLLSQYNAQRVDLIQKEHLIDRLAKVIIRQEFTIEETMHELKRIIESSPDLKKYVDFNPPPKPEPIFFKRHKKEVPPKFEKHWILKLSTYKF